MRFLLVLLEYEASEGVADEKALVGGVYEDCGRVEVLCREEGVGHA